MAEVFEGRLDGWLRACHGLVLALAIRGSLTDDTGAGNVPSPSTAGVEANSSEPVNAYMLLDATPAAGGGVQREAGERTSYALEGLASELANHKGHRVEIVGSCSPAYLRCRVQSPPLQRYNASRYKPSRWCPRSVNLDTPGEQSEEMKHSGEKTVTLAKIVTRRDISLRRIRHHFFQR